MLDPVSAIQRIYSIAKLVYAQVEQAKANRAQCLRLQQRIQIIEDAIAPLKNLKDSERVQYQKGLNELVNTMTKALELVTKFSNGKNWFKEVVKAGTNKSHFEAITKDLADATMQLNFGMVAKQIMDNKQDREDQEKDFAELTKKQDEILKYNQQMIEELQHLRGDHQEGQEILLQQMASLKGKIAFLITNNSNDNASKPPISKKYTVSFCDLLFDKKIGEGSFGKVYVGRWREQEVAIKMLEGELSKQQRDEFIREVKIQSRLRSPRIVSFYQVVSSVELRKQN